MKQNATDLLETLYTQEKAYVDNLNLNWPQDNKDIENWSKLFLITYFECDWSSSHQLESLAMLLLVQYNYITYNQLIEMKENYMKKFLLKGEENE